VVSFSLAVVLMAMLTHGVKGRILAWLAGIYMLRHLVVTSWTSPRNRSRATKSISNSWAAPSDADFATAVDAGPAIVLSLTPFWEAHCVGHTLTIEQALSAAIGA